MKKRTVTLIAVVILAVIVLSGCFFTVREDEYACTVRFSKIIATTSDAGLHFKLPFVDSVKYFTKATQLYDIPPSEVLTSDKQNMTVDCYILWSIGDPKLFYQRLGTTSNAEQRLDALTYNELKTVMGTLAQADIVNMEDGAKRNDIYNSIATDVDALAQTYGIRVEDVKIKQFDLPESNLNAVYNRMISERSQIAEKYTADGNYEASIIRNNVDKQVNIIVSNAQAEAAKLEAEGEHGFRRQNQFFYLSLDHRFQVPVPKVHSVIPIHPVLLPDPPEPTPDAWYNDTIYQKETWKTVPFSPVVHRFHFRFSAHQRVPAFLIKMPLRSYRPDPVPHGCNP